MIKSRSIATRMDAKTWNELRKIFPDSKPSEIIRILAEERIVAERNRASFFEARKALNGKKSKRELL